MPRYSTTFIKFRILKRKPFIPCAFVASGREVFERQPSRVNGTMSANRSLPSSSPARLSVRTPFPTSFAFFCSYLIGRKFWTHFRESVRNVGFPQLTSPVVQMFRDLAAAHHQPSSASPALRSLRHHSANTSASSSTNESGGDDPTLFSNVRLPFFRVWTWKHF